MEGQAVQANLPASPPRASAFVPVAMPEKYDGNPDHCQAFLMQCGLFIEEHPEHFTDETARVRFVSSLLTGRSRDWATALWMDDSPLLDSAREFQQAFKGIFNHPTIGHSLGKRLSNLKQGARPLAEFALEFRTISAGLRRPEEVLRILYRRTLNPEIQDELMSRGATLCFEDYIRFSLSPLTTVSGSAVADVPPRRSPLCHQQPQRNMRSTCSSDMLRSPPRKDADAPPRDCAYIAGKQDTSYVPALFAHTVLKPRQSPACLALSSRLPCLPGLLSSLLPSLRLHVPSLPIGLTFLAPDPP
nr:uncharacterized protein LOC111844764 [Paramormyrops kingsleyae]